MNPTIESRGTFEDLSVYAKSTPYKQLTIPILSEQNMQKLDELWKIRSKPAFNARTLLL